MDAKITNIGLAVAAAVVVFSSVGLARAVFTEDVSDRLSRLEVNYSDQVQVIDRANEVIEKQYDVKMRAERSLKSFAIELASLKVQLEMGKEDPNMQEVNRLSNVASGYATELGLGK